MKHLILLCALTGVAIAQGPLTPPPGPDPSIGPANAVTPGGLPQATMKTLHQVEPRTAIPASTSGVVIGQSGAYYLTGNIEVADGAGVSIGASGVTLDLNGFSIISTNASPDNGDHGIALGSNVKNITIRNGVICGGGTSGKFRFGIGHLAFTSSTNVTVADVTSSDTTQWGIALDPGSNSRVERCLVQTDGITGAIQAGLIADCSVIGGSVYGRIVKGCSATTPGTSGIVADVVENCYATSAGTAIQAKCLVNSYGTGGGNNDVISAGVAQNVWAEGGSGNGDGIEATVLSNGFGKRQNDLAGTSSGHGINTNVVVAANGIASNGAGVNAQLASFVNATSTPETNVASIGGISATVVNSSLGTSTIGQGIAVKRDLRGVVSNCVAATDGAIAILFDQTSGVVTGSSAISTGVNGDGIFYWGGVVQGCRGEGRVGINALIGSVANSFGKGQGGAGIVSGGVTGCYGSTSNGPFGVSAQLIHATYGVGGTGTSATFEFDSN
jgi:hypothetical protein